MTTSKFVDTVRTACEQALVERGFIRLRKHAPALEISKDFLGWVGLNVGNYRTYMNINPFVGVHATTLEKLIAECAGRPYRRGDSASYSIHLGELAPNERVFNFRPENPTKAEAERFAEVMSRFAPDYMRSIASYEALLPLIKDRVPRLGSNPELYAGALFLIGRSADAKEFMDNQTAVVQRKHPSSVAEWQVFATELARRFAS